MSLSRPAYHGSPVRPSGSFGASVLHLLQRLALRLAYGGPDEQQGEQRGLSGPPLQQETGTVLGAFAKVESVAAGFQWGLRWLSLMMLTLGLAVALLLWQAARGLRAPPGAGYS